MTIEEARALISAHGCRGHAASDALTATIDDEADRRLVHWLCVMGLPPPEMRPTAVGKKWGEEVHTPAQLPPYQVPVDTSHMGTREARNLLRELFPSLRTQKGRRDPTFKMDDEPPPSWDTLIRCIEDNLYDPEEL